jgi:hypothetical protein
MLKPLFQERMRRIKVDKWVIRLWFNDKAPASLDDILVQLKASIDATHTFKTEDVEAIIFRNFTEGVAAVEVLSAATFNGRVSYFEWP